jgi:hypothetical protein
MEFSIRILVDGKEEVLTCRDGEWYGDNSKFQTFFDHVSDTLRPIFQKIIKRKMQLPVLLENLSLVDQAAAARLQQEWADYKKPISQLWTEALDALSH